MSGLLREEAARARRLQHELSSLSNADSVSQSELERRAHEAEEREKQVVNLLEEERARWSDMLKNQVGGFCAFRQCRDYEEESSI